MRLHPRKLSKIHSFTPILNFPQVGLEDNVIPDCDRITSTRRDGTDNLICAKSRIREKGHLQIRHTEVKKVVQRLNSGRS